MYMTIDFSISEFLTKDRICPIKYLSECHVGAQMWRKKAYSSTRKLIPRNTEMSMLRWWMGAAGVPQGSTVRPVARECHTEPCFEMAKTKPHCAWCVKLITHTCAMRAVDIYIPMRILWYSKNFNLTFKNILLVLFYYTSTHSFFDFSMSSDLKLANILGVAFCDI